MWLALSLMHRSYEVSPTPRWRLDETPLNPTNGSWWIVQIQPTYERAARVLKSDPASETKEAEIIQKPFVGHHAVFSTKRLDLNNPPTPVGGICRSLLEAKFCRLEI